MAHSFFMHRCLELAEKGRGLVGINPMVGALLVREGSVIAEGYHSQWGKAHAERDLLQKFDQEIRSTDVLYVNLEPCCHHGKTPPCTDIIFERGVKHVVYGMVDPDPEVAGKGIDHLRSKGIEVMGPIERTPCEWLNRGFISVQTCSRPWITLHEARTQDGRYAKDDGSKLKITNHEQDTWAHTWLRAKHDAILVGANTMTIDNPLLNTRFVQNTKVDQTIHHPLRLILNPSLLINNNLQALTGERAAGTIVLTSPEASESSKASEFRAQGVRVLPVAVEGAVFDWDALWNLLITPTDDFFGITSVLVEGGPKTWKTFRDAGMVDAEVTLVGA